MNNKKLSFKEEILNVDFPVLNFRGNIDFQVNHKGKVKSIATAKLFANKKPTLKINIPRGLSTDELKIALKIVDNFADRLAEIEGVTIPQQTPGKVNSHIFDEAVKDMRGFATVFVPHKDSSRRIGHAYIFNDKPPEFSVDFFGGMSIIQLKEFSVSLNNFIQSVEQLVVDIEMPEVLNWLNMSNMSNKGFQPLSDEQASGFYVDDNCVVCSLASPPSGCHFGIEDQGDGFYRIGIIKTSTGELLNVYGFHP